MMPYWMQWRLLLVFFTLLMLGVKLGNGCNSVRLDISPTAITSENVLIDALNQTLLNANVTIGAHDPLCYTVQLDGQRLSLNRYQNNLLVQRSVYSTGCSQISPAKLVTTIISEADVAVTVLTDFKHEDSRTILQAMLHSNQVSMIIDLRQTVNWTRVKEKVNTRRYVLILCDTNCTVSAIEQSRKAGLTSYKIRWLITHPEIDVNRFYTFSEELRLVVIQRQNSTSGSDNALKLSLADSITSTVTSGAASSVNYAQCVFDIFNKRFLDLGFDIIGNWTVSNGSSVALGNKLFTMEIDKFRNKTFTVTTLEFSIFQKRPSDPNGIWTGLSFQIMDALAKDMNFTYKVIRQKNGIWGVPQPNRSIHEPWQGMIGEVMRREVDFAAAGFSVTSQRQTVVDFAASIYREETIVILQRPKPESRVWIYVNLLQPLVWAAVFGVCVATIIAYWLFNNASSIYKSLGNTDPVANEMQRLGYSVIYFFFTLVSEGGNYLPVNHAGRIIVTTWWMFCIVFVATYSGNLVSVLATINIRLPFTTLEGLVDQSTYKWGLVKGVALTTLFQQSSSPTYRKIWYGDNRILVDDYETAYLKLNEKWAFVAEMSWYKVKQGIACNITRLPIEFFPTFYAWAFPKGSPLTEVFSKRITYLLESGVIARWITRLNPSTTCSAISTSTNAQLHLKFDTVGGAFYILCIGVGISFLCFLFEFVKVRFLNWKRNRNIRRAILILSSGDRRTSTVTPQVDGNEPGQLVAVETTETNISDSPGGNRGHGRSLSACSGSLSPDGEEQRRDSIMMRYMPSLKSLACSGTNYRGRVVK